MGVDALSPSDRLTLDTARLVREDFLGQNAFSDTDSYTPLNKQAGLLALILKFYELGQKAIAKGASYGDVFAVSSRERIGRAKDIPTEEYATKYSEIENLLKKEMEELMSREAQ